MQKASACAICIDVRLCKMARRYLVALLSLSEIAIFVGLML